MIEQSATVCVCVRDRERRLTPVSPIFLVLTAEYPATLYYKHCTDCPQKDSWATSINYELTVGLQSGCVKATAGTCLCRMFPRSVYLDCRLRAISACSA